MEPENLTCDGLTAASAAETNRRNVHAPNAGLSH